MVEKTLRIVKDKHSNVTDNISSEGILNTDTGSPSETI